MADPISFAVGSAIIGAGGSFAVASAVATVAFYAVTAAPFIIPAVVADKQRRALANARGVVGDDRALQQAIPQAAPAHMLLLGYAHVAGTPFFIRGNEDLRPYFYKGLLLAAHECDGLDSVWINGTEVFINSETYEATSTPFNDGVQNFLSVSFRNGSIDQAIDPILAADFPDLPSTYRQRGNCTAVVKAHYGTGDDRDAQDDKHKELYGDGNFEPIFRVRGSKVYDPRDPMQSVSDPSTWAWSRNAVLNAAHYLCWFYKGMRNRIDWDRIADGANIADQEKLTKGGVYFPQFTVDGGIFSTDPVQDAVSDLMSACGGRVIRKAGKVYIYPNQKEQSVGTIHAGNFRGQVQYSNGLPIGQLANVFKPEFFSPERGYKIVPGPVIRDTAAITADGEERERTERYPFTETHERAQRLAMAEYLENRVQETVTLGVDLDAVQWDAGRVITLDLARFMPQLTGQWRIIKKSWSDGLLGYVLQLKKYDGAVLDFDPQTDEQDFEAEEIA